MFCILIESRKTKTKKLLCRLHLLVHITLSLTFLIYPLSEILALSDYVFYTQVEPFEFCDDCQVRFCPGSLQHVPPWTIRLLCPFQKMLSV